MKKMTCPKCESYKMHYDMKLDELRHLIASFPPYHGNLWNYDKTEVEDWLKKARKIVDE